MCVDGYFIVKKKKHTLHKAGSCTLDFLDERCSFSSKELPTLPTSFFAHSQNTRLPVNRGEEVMLHTSPSFLLLSPPPFWEHLVFYEKMHAFLWMDEERGGGEGVRLEFFTTIVSSLIPAASTNPWLCSGGGLQQGIIFILCSSYLYTIYKFSCRVYMTVIHVM